MKRIFLYSLLTASAFFLTTCSRNPVTGKKELAFTSEAQEIAMGQEADPQILAQYGLYADSSLQRFITEKGRAMGKISHRPNLEYHFRVVDSEVLNAFAVPGGYVYFTRGIMAHFNNEAQFAGVLGHEIGHITARHTVQQQRNAMLGQLGLIAGVIINPNLARFAESASQGLGLLFLKFGRDAEKQSDKLGVEYSCKINYDSHQMADFFKTLERSSGESANQLPEFLSTHPNPGDRYNTVHQLSSDFQKQNNLTNLQVNRNTYLRRIEGIIYGEDPRGGYMENSVFYHPEMKFQFSAPQGWMYNNSPTRVQYAPKDGSALLYLTAAQGNSLQEAAGSFIQQNKLTSEQSGQVSVNGLPAIAIVFSQAQQQQDGSTAIAIRGLTYFIQYNGTIYQMVGVCAPNNFNTLAPAFKSTMESFRQLTDQAKINKKPQRVRIKTINQAITLQQAFTNYKVPATRMEEFAILNGMQLTDKLSVGTLIKVVEY